MDEIHYLLGNTCNLNCDFCCWDIRLPDVSFGFKKKIINQIVETGIKKVTISGGEPLCSNDFLKVLGYMKKCGLEVVLHSNGLKIDKAIAEKISPLISRVSLILDGADEKTVLKMRKNGKIFNHTTFLIKLFHELNIPVSVKTLVTKINQSGILSIGKILSKLPIEYWSVLEFNPIGKGKVNKNQFLISRKDFDKICAEIKRKFSSMPIRIRKFNDDKNKYCFIAADGNAFTYKKGRGDVFVGDVKKTSLAYIISRNKLTS